MNLAESVQYLLATRDWATQEEAESAESEYFDVGTAIDIIEQFVDAANQIEKTWANS